jgi:hypothetical protein
LSRSCIEIRRYTIPQERRLFRETPEHLSKYLPEDHLEDHLEDHPGHHPENYPEKKPQRTLQRHFRGSFRNHFREVSRGRLLGLSWLYLLVPLSNFA